MQVKVLSFKKPKFSPIIPYFFRNNQTKEIWFRKKFQKLKIPAICVSTGEKTLGRAKARAELLVQRHKNKYLGISDEHVFGFQVTKTVRSVIAELLIDHTQKLRISTQAQHKIFLKKIEGEFGARDIKSLMLGDFEDWVRREKSSPSLPNRPKRKTFMDYAKYMNLMMRFAYDRKYVAHLIRFKSPDKKATTGRVYTTKEIESLWQNMNETMRDQFVLSYECFMRLREVLKLTWDRVDLMTGVVTLGKEDVKTGSRTGKGRQFVLSPRALERLKNRSLKILGTPYVFPSRINRMKPAYENRTAWVRAKKAAGISGRARWHDLRHTALTRALVEKSQNPILVAEYAGVGMRTIQSVYLHSKADHTRSISSVVSVFDEKGVTTV